MRALALVLLVAACITATVTGGRPAAERPPQPPPHRFVAGPDGQPVVCAGGWAVALNRGEPVSWRC